LKKEVAMSRIIYMNLFNNYVAMYYVVYIYVLLFHTFVQRPNKIVNHSWPMGFFHQSDEVMTFMLANPNIYLLKTNIFSFDLMGGIIFMRQRETKERGLNSTINNY